MRPHETHHLSLGGGGDKNVFTMGYTSQIKLTEVSAKEQIREKVKITPFTYN